MMKNPVATANKGTGFERDWTKGSIIRNLWMLAWPLIVSDSINLAGPIITMIWVAKLGPASLAGVGIASMATLVTEFGVWSLNTGMFALVARHVGAGDNKGANHVAQQNLVAVLVWVMVFTSIGIILTVPILKLFGVDPDVVIEGSAYLRITFLSSAFVAFHQMTEIIMQSSGDTRTPMKISLVSRVVQAVICPCLVLGWWIFPRLGVSGAAITNVISLGLAMGLGLWVVFTGRTRLHLTLKDFHLDLNTIWQIIKIGIPNGFMSIQQNIGGIVLMKLLIPFGTLPVAAHTLVGSTSAFITMPSNGFARASGVLVGQNLGAQQPERAVKGSWLAFSFAGSIITILAIIVLIWPVAIIRVFSSDPEVIKIASIFLRISVAALFARVLASVFQEGLVGAGDTLPPMIIGLIGLWVVTIPLAYFLPQLGNLNVYGIRWALVGGQVFATAAVFIYFQTGRWKSKKV